MIRQKIGKKLVHRSGFEDFTADKLKLLKIPYEYETLELAYTIPSSIHKYTPDFILANGIILECKGVLDLETRKKMKYVIAQNPELDIRMVFQKPQNKLSKASKTTYAMWCAKNKIKWGTVADIPSWSRENKV